MATVIVAVIIFGLIAFAAYQIYRGHKNHTMCNGSCSGCWHANRCSSEHREEVHETMKQRKNS